MKTTVEPDRYARLRETATFREGGFARWNRARIAVFGAGALGGLLSQGIVRSGAGVAVVDFDVGAPENQGTQIVEPGISKVESVIAACNAIDVGRAVGYPCDVRHVGVGVLGQYDLFIDCTDDANLALPLTELSNGLGITLLRCALDGSGATEMGRVLCSSGATNHACQVCSLSLEDIRPNRARTGCPNPAAQLRQPTIAGGATAMAIAGLGLLSAQRLVTGNDAELVYNHETLLDFTHIELHAMEHRRSDRCLSGHLRWNLKRIDLAVASATLDAMFAVGSNDLSTPEVSLEPYLHPFNVLADCDCGQVSSAVGTNWAAAPQCPDCRRLTSWRRIVQHHRITRPLARELGILTIPLTELGLPNDGAMIVARSAKSPPMRYVLRS